MNQISIWGQVSMGAFLGILTFLDLMYQKIPVWILTVGGILVGGIWIWEAKMNWMLIVAGAGVGVLFLLISHVTRQALGYADSLLIFFFGMSLGVWNLMELLFYAFCLSAIFGSIQMIRKKCSKKTAYPFIPFLTVAYAGVLFL